MAVTVSFRAWALSSPQEYALIFGSPVPGYQAPADTIDPAARVPLLLLAIVDERSRRTSTSSKAPSKRRVPLPKSVKADLVALGRQVAPKAGEELLARAVLAWTELVGLVSLELFGHLHNVIHDYAGHFEYQTRRVAAELNL